MSDETDDKLGAMYAAEHRAAARQGVDLIWYWVLVARRDGGHTRAYLHRTFEMAVANGRDLIARGKGRHEGVEEALAEIAEWREDKEAAYELCWGQGQELDLEYRPVRD